MDRITTKYKGTSKTLYINENHEKTGESGVTCMMEIAYPQEYDTVTRKLFEDINKEIDCIGGQYEDFKDKIKDRLE